MATLADSFVADLKALTDNAEALLLDKIEELNRDVDMDGIEALNYDDLNAIAKLQKTPRYHDIVKKVEAALGGSYGMQQGKKKWLRGCIETNEGSLTKDDHQYQLIMECNTLAADIENEISIIHSFIRDKYTLKFPELESLVFHPIDYARVVKRVGNEMDLTLINLDGLLPSAVIMVLSITASTTTGKPLSKEDLQKTLEACDTALALDDSRNKLLNFVESRMGYVAPNLSAIVGVVVAAKLMGAAGGLEALSKMPACNLQVLGAKKKITNGLSTASSFMHIGFVMETEVVQSTPPTLKTRACRLVAGKAALAARVDETKGDLTGRTGQNMREHIRKKIEKWQESPPPRQPKPLPIPYSNPKKKRGGRRLRKMKERYALTDMQRLANRMQFGIAEESSLGDGIGKGYGMLSQAGSGKLRVSTVQRKLVAKVAKRPKKKSYVSNGAAASGLTSSLAFTPVQGIELTNPQADASLFGPQSDDQPPKKRLGGFLHI